MTDSSRAGLPRILEVSAAGLALLAAAPLLAITACAIKLTSPGPVLFRQRRLGKGGKPFELIKLRSMTTDSAAAPGAQVTRSGDPRITAVGRLLRASKVDEIPQLWNVLTGDMALVGPRPEVPRFVDSVDPLWQRVLAARPGLTDPVTLILRDEEALISAHCGNNAKPLVIETFYRRELLPVKLRGYAGYLAQRSWMTDLAVLFRTAWRIIRPDRRPVASLTELERRLSEITPAPRNHDPRS